MYADGQHVQTQQQGGPTEITVNRLGEIVNMSAELASLIVPSAIPEIQLAAGLAPVLAHLALAVAHLARHHAAAINPGQQQVQQAPLVTGGNVHAPTPSTSDDITL